MTFNPNWRKLTKTLQEKGKPFARSDIISRVFAASKLNKLKDGIVKINVLDVVVSHVYVIKMWVSPLLLAVKK